jgi:hypothetical protein
MDTTELEIQIADGYAKVVTDENGRIIFIGDRFLSKDFRFQLNIQNTLKSILTSRVLDYKKAESLITFSFNVDGEFKILSQILIRNF